MFFCSFCSFLGGSAYCDPFCALTACILLFGPWARWMNCEICSKHSKIREIQKIHKTFETQTRVEIGGPKDSKKCSNFANASKKTRSKQADDRKTFCSFLRVFRLIVFLMLILYHVLGIQRSLVNIWPIFFFCQISRYLGYLWQKEGIMSKICVVRLERYVGMKGWKLEMI